MTFIENGAFVICLDVKKGASCHVQVLTLTVNGSTRRKKVLSRQSFLPALLTVLFVLSSDEHVSVTITYTGRKFLTPRGGSGVDDVIDFIGRSFARDGAIANAPELLAFECGTNIRAACCLSSANMRLIAGVAPHAKASTPAYRSGYCARR